jgi:hypothetical protein
MSAQAPSRAHSGEQLTAGRTIDHLRLLGNARGAIVAFPAERSSDGSGAGGYHSIRRKILPGARVGRSSPAAKEKSMTEEGPISRRSALAGGACLAMLSERADAQMPDSPAAPPASKPRFASDRDSDGAFEVAGIHKGKGKGRVKLFRFDGATAPTYMLIYDLPPGASEGVHVHFLDNRNGEGSFDEYYYILSGQGQMEIDGEIVPVAAGDHVHTPIEVAHGIENTHASEPLRVYLIYIRRGTETSPVKRPASPPA